MHSNVYFMLSLNLNQFHILWCISSGPNADADVTFACFLRLSYLKLSIKLNKSRYLVASL